MPELKPKMLSNVDDDDDDDDDEDEDEDDGNDDNNVHRQINQYKELNQPVDAGTRAQIVWQQQQQQQQQIKK